MKKDFLRSSLSVSRLARTSLDRAAMSSNEQIIMSLPTSPFGCFSEDGLEYIIDSPKTPRPWVNVLGNGRYGAVISQAGGGFSWLDNCQLFRLTRWEQDLVQDRQGRFLYVQDLDRSEDIWSTTFQPTRIDGSYRVRHGLGYSVFESSYRDISIEQTVFVPLQETCEVWLVEIENQRPTTAKLRLASYIEWHLGSVGEWHREFHRLFIETKSHGNFCTALKHPELKEGAHELIGATATAYHALLGVEDVRWVTGKDDFLGPQGEAFKPCALVESNFPKGNDRWQDPIASGICEVSLHPGEKRTLALILGAKSDAAECQGLMPTFSCEKAQGELEKVREHWKSICGTTAVDTPDCSLNVMTNAWLKYQTIACRLQARCAYYQQGGAYGYRDQLQDSLLMLTLNPKQTKEQLVLHAEAMYEDGGVRHWWHPNSNIYVESKHSDTCLWLGYAALGTYDEVGETGFLDQPCRYLNRDSQAFAGKGSLLDHCLRGIDRALNRLSSRGLPKIEAGDWNDGLSHAGLDGKGESVWLAMFLYHILKRYAPLLQGMGMHELARAFDSAAEALRDAVDKHAWDGEWYLAGTRDDGKPFGSHQCENGRIFLNTQTWAIISDIAGENRRKKTLDAVRKHMLKPYGALLLSPAYQHVDPYIGYITRYAPGVRENGGVYSHASCWAIQAFAMAGDVETAYEIYRSMAPPLRGQDSNYWAEPYVMPGNIDGPDSPYEGRAGWTWYTGSSAWMVRVALDWLCGVRAAPEGLVLGLESPKDWPSYQVRRLFRGDAFVIDIEGRGKTWEMEVDGEPTTERTLTATGLGRRRQVTVRRRS